ncbi:bacterial Ig-like domain-containing protein [Isobaculum melis]|uniref:Uncharacterized conserved protein YkwD, contains CAP (CSP/antigen 5/PR1) domain n=1 Tax=Isobaculum melis TaxID=142588 RepID=A0A1H9TDF5_9LACT|nr:bacterial Ig-like domain-containing protein [Isobaculum melis]SER95232.1 Uncharacterized conserved protein YkwD, contains CAP (CSP/antigen 5/PR1) domain [Isobaculum melis]
MQKKKTMKKVKKQWVVASSLMAGVALSLAFGSTQASAREWVANTPESIQITQGQKEYTIKWGDTLWAISEKSGLTIETLASLNNIANANLIYEGNILSLSADGVSVKVTDAAGNTLAEQPLSQADQAGIAKKAQEAQEQAKKDSTYPSQHNAAKQPDKKPALPVNPNQPEKEKPSDTKDQSTLVVQDSTIAFDSKWQAEDNFVAATDKNGKAIAFKEVKVAGTVDTSKPGTYKVVYTYNKITAVANVTVKEKEADQTTVLVKDSTIELGTTWTAEDNFISATDKNGKAVDFEKIELNGTVETDTPGTYEITYTYGTASATAKVTVKEAPVDLTSITVKDIEIEQYAAWSKEDNFVAAQDEFGHPLTVDQLTVDANIYMATPGKYQVIYTYKNTSVTATVTVLAKDQVDLTSITVKDIEIEQYAAWSKEDNFVSAQDEFGNPLTIDQLTVDANIYMATPGEYQVVYTYKNTSVTATVTVKEKAVDLTAIVAMDSTIEFGSTWTAEDNFISAVDKDGLAVDFSEVQVTGSVDTSTVGTYKITYTYNGKSTIATITVNAKADLTSLSIRNTSIAFGSTWQAVDNFVSATDADGNTVELDKVTVVGTVNTNTAGIYTVKYTIGSISKSATITVEPKVDLSDIQVKDSTIEFGAAWTASDNFISAKDADGKTVGMDKVTIVGTVNTNVAGTYTITYIIGNASKTATITVNPKIDLSDIQVKDSAIKFGSTWTASDNFVSAKDEDGLIAGMDKVTVKGTVNTNVAGTYTVTYTIGKATKTATITVNPKVDLSDIQVKDSTIEFGAAWTASDNFVSAKDEDGNAANIDKVTVTGTVDTNTAGTYTVTYKIGKASKVATITVNAKIDLSDIQVKDSVIEFGAPWTASDNFVSAKDENGNAVGMDKVTITGAVKSNEAGTYTVTYTIGKASKTANITVNPKVDLSDVVVKNSTIEFGTAWQAGDNFVSAKDENGVAIGVDKVTVTGTVNTNLPGTYQVSYTVGKVTKTAQIIVNPKAAYQPNVVAIQDKIVTLVNGLRAEVGQPTLTQNTALTNGATIRTNELISLFSHTRPSGAEWGTILGEVNYSYTAAAENIAWSSRAADSDDAIAMQLFTQWKESPGHYDNMIHPKMKEIGIGVTIHNGEVFGTQLFGAR